MDDEKNDVGHRAATLLRMLTGRYKTEFRWDEENDRIAVTGKDTGHSSFLLRLENIRGRGGIGEFRTEGDALVIDSFDLKVLEGLQSDYNKPRAAADSKPSRRSR